MRLRALTALLLVSAGCDRSPSTPPPAPELPPPVVSTSPPAASSAPVPSASTPAMILEAGPAPEPSGSAPPPAALPAVRVENIGMHIGGGPNDAVNKAPIADSVAPHFDELRACWAKVADPAHGGDFGVDLLIQPGGGHAVVSHPRTSIHPDAFRDCVVAVFEGIEFRKPLKGLTMVSYSLRFTP